MSDLSKNAYFKRDTKNYIENYWTKRADAFAALRRQERTVKNTASGSARSCSICRPQNSCVSLTLAAAPVFSVLLANEGHLVTGIDLTPAMIAQAEALAAAEGCGCTFQTADAEHTAFSDGSFDVVIARNLMWNLPHPETAYAEWLRVLAPKGILLNYDAEYAKDHHRQKLPALNAHADVSAELLNECHNIYHMLEISLFERPRWDLEILKALGSCSCSVDQSIGDRIYAEQDIFYIPVPMFCIKAVKN
ncbi:MAG: class I SAM-dependent methyltransferase [Phascolarctobacterium faecium]